MRTSKKSEIIEKYLKKTLSTVSKSAHLLLPLYINHIRNHRELTLSEQDTPMNI